MTPDGDAATADAGADAPAGLRELAEELIGERSALARELEEIALLLQQARTEAERHELRRAQAQERLDQVEAQQAPDRKEVADARQGLIQQTGRAALMSSQVQLLEGKQKTIRRFEDRLRRTVESLEAIESEGGPPAGGSRTSARAVLAAQEQMRREIARQMHDGPAQSIANIALQAEVVQRLMARDPERGQAELAELRAMVQHALDATKSFIFDVRPMVLDDLGIVPTLRRSARERAQRTGVAIRFESVGADRRLEPELESTLYRIIDDTVAGFVSRSPAEVFVRLDWTTEALEASVLSRAPGEASRPADGKSALQTGADAAPADEQLPPALAQMIDDQRERAAAAATARRQAHSLPAEVWAQIQARAATVNIDVRLEDDGRLLLANLTVPS